MGNLGFQELFIIFLVALVVVGPKRMPEIARALGNAVRAFQDALKQSPPHDPRPPAAADGDREAL